ncbi:hypothetical protein [Nocardia salmonicida]|uniref:hypothetical protein n=1 Tax=Nocardia salmonicida TaxID=53431 RepID=UPI003403983E
MATRSITKIITPTASAIFFRHDGWPEYLLPRIAQFVVLQEMAGEPISPQAWRDFAEMTAEGGRPVVAADEITGVPGDIDDMYVIDTTTGALSFSYLRKQSQGHGVRFWERRAEADSVAEVIAAGVDFAEQLARRMRQHTFNTADQIAAADQWAEQARQLGVIHATITGPATLPDPTELPARRDGQEPTDHAHEVAAYCATRADSIYRQVKAAEAAGEPDDAVDELRNELRGWMNTGYQFWAAAI